MATKAWPPGNQPTGKDEPPPLISQDDSSDDDDGDEGPKAIPARPPAYLLSWCRARWNLTIGDTWTSHDIV